VGRFDGARYRLRTGTGCRPGVGNFSVFRRQNVAHRVTNRRRYDGQPVAADVLGRLTQLVGELDGARAHWIVNRSRLGAWAGYIARADATMLGEASMRRAFLANVRFDQVADAAVDEGLSLASLELSAMDRVALRVLRCHGTPQLLASIGLNQFQALGDEFKSLMPGDAGRRPGFFMRFGHAPATSGRTGRRGWQTVTTIR